MRKEYNPEALIDYRTYRREFRKKFPGSKMYMDFEEFEFLWNGGEVVPSRAVRQYGIFAMVLA